MRAHAAQLNGTIFFLLSRKGDERSKEANHLSRGLPEAMRELGNERRIVLEQTKNLLTLIDSGRRRNSEYCNGVASAHGHLTRKLPLSHSTDERMR